VDAFTQGRTPSSLESPYEGERLLFAGQLVDGKTIEEAHYSHSTFANVSFLDVKIKNSRFRDCTFIECYFRKADIRSSVFVGCKFINCNFSHTIIRTSDFRYADFRGSHPSYAELAHSAPTEPNLRSELFFGISTAAESRGDAKEARQFRVAAIDARKDHLKAALKSSSTWYKEHYPPLARIGVAGSLIWHYLNRLLWRHGESAWRLLLSTLITVGLVFPALYYLARSGFVPANPIASYGDAISLSSSNFLSIDRLSDAVPSTGWTKILSGIEALAGVIFGGMFVTLLVKALLRR
jgi:hypothetical protein